MNDMTDDIKDAQADTFAEDLGESVPSDAPKNKSPLRPWTDEDRQKAISARKERAMMRKDASQVMDYFAFDPLKEMIQMFLHPDTGQRVKAQIGLDLLSYKYTKPKDKMQADATSNMLSDLAALISNGGRPLPPTAQLTVDVDVEADVINNDHDDDTNDMD